MIVDLHNHCTQSKNTTLTFSSYYNELKTSRDIAIGLTEHNRLGKESAVDCLVFNGIEILNDFGDFLVFGVSEECIQYRQDMMVLIDFVHSQEGIIIAAHPFTGYGICNVLSENDYKPIIKRLDAIETLNGLCSHKDNARAGELAVHYSKPGTGGSDAHHEEQLLTCGTMFNQQISTMHQLVEAIKSGDCKPVRLR